MFEGFFYTTGTTIRFYDLKKAVSQKIYSSQNAEIDGLYYHNRLGDLYFTELKYKKSHDGGISNVTYTVRKLNLENTKVAPVIYQETRGGNDLNYYLFAQYRYNNFLLFDIEGGDSSYHKIYDLNLKKFIFTTGEGLYSSFFDYEAKIFIHNYNNGCTINEFIKINLTSPIKTSKITQKEYERFLKNTSNQNSFKVEELPVLKDYPQDRWGNIFRCCIREKTFLVLNTFYAKTPLVVGGEKSYLSNTITFYDLDNDAVVQNIILKDFIHSENVRQPFCLKGDSHAD
jgi:hypothetical protein